MTQQAFVLWFADDGNTNLAALNALLDQGWRVKLATPMSGTAETGQETPQSPFPYSRAALALGRDGGHGDGGHGQRAFVLWFADDGNTNLAALNGMLGQNWDIAQLVAMSGGGEHGPETPGSAFPYSRALAILQHS